MRTCFANIGMACVTACFAFVVVAAVSSGNTTVWQDVMGSPPGGWVNTSRAAFSVSGLNPGWMYNISVRVVDDVGIVGTSINWVWTVGGCPIPTSAYVVSDVQSTIVALFSRAVTWQTSASLDRTKTAGFEVSLDGGSWMPTDVPYLVLDGLAGEAWHSVQV